MVVVGVPVAVISPVVEVEGVGLVVVVVQLMVVDTEEEEVEGRRIMPYQIRMFYQIL